MMMAGELEPQDVPNDGILSWYDRTRPMWIDLIGDYAGKELFLVEGDSLLRECFEDERIDFAGKVLHYLLPDTNRIPDSKMAMTYFDIPLSVTNLAIGL